MCFCLFFVHHFAQLGVVTTEGGQVKGENVRIRSGRYMDVFKGIPFADAPGRFEKPKRHTGWDGELTASGGGDDPIHGTLTQAEII